MRCGVRCTLCNNKSEYLASDHTSSFCHLPPTLWWTAPWNCEPKIFLLEVAFVRVFYHSNGKAKDTLSTGFESRLSRCNMDLVEETI